MMYRVTRRSPETGNKEYMSGTGQWPGWTEKVHRARVFERAAHLKCSLKWVGGSFYEKLFNLAVVEDYETGACVIDVAALRADPSLLKDSL